MKGTPTIGFVVIGRNEGARLEACLRSVLVHGRPVVYADSASTDASVALAERLGASATVLADDGRLNAARGRNAGFARLIDLHPECDAVQFLDGDCILQPDWIARASSFLAEHPDVAIVCGRRFEAHPDASIYNALCDAEWNTPVGEANASGGDALVRRSAFEQVGGFRPSLRAGEEPDMGARMRAAGWKIWRIDVPMTEHDAKILTFSQWWRRTLRGGFGYAQVWSATGELPERVYSRQLRSAVTWAVVVPAVVVILALAVRQPLVLLGLPLVYGAQVARNTRHVRGSGQSKWANARLLLLAKFAETIGAAQYLLSAGQHRVPEYKSND